MSRDSCVGERGRVNSKLRWFKFYFIFALKIGILKQVETMFFFRFFILLYDLLKRNLMRYFICRVAESDWYARDLTDIQN